MHSLAIGNDGRIYMAWLDERNVKPMEMNDPKMAPAAKGHHMESNRELFFASSADRGHSFTANQRVAADVCPCCKTSIAIASDGRVYLSWRQVLPGDYRHIAVTSSADQGKTFAAAKIVSDDQWLIPGCPVSGSAISVTQEGDVRALWYSGGKNGQTGLYSSLSNDHGGSFQPRRLLAAGDTRGTPVLVRSAKSAYAVWESGPPNAPKIFVAMVGGASATQSASVADGALPAAVDTKGRLVVAFVAKGEQHQEIRVVSTAAEVR
jgi:hypothetical protein